MTQFVLTPKRARERELLANLNKAWSLYPGDETAELRDPRTGRRHTYPYDAHLPRISRAELRAIRLARLARVMPTVCTALPLAGRPLVPARIVRFQ